MKTSLCSGIALLTCALAQGLLCAGEGNEPQAKGQAQPAAAARIRILNVDYVLQGSRKHKQYARQIRELVQARADVEEAKQRRLNTEKMLRNPKEYIRDAFASPFPMLSQSFEMPSPDKAQKAQARARRAEDKQANEHMLAAYKDIEKAAGRYAKARDLDVLLFYSNPLSEKDRHSPKNIKRLLGLGTLFPLYAGPGMDVSEEAVVTLNEDAEGEESASSRSEKKEEPPAAGARDTRARVALINLTYVIKNYKKYRTFPDEMKKVLDTYMERQRELSKELDQASKSSHDFGRSEEEREASLKKVKKLLKEIKDNQVEAKRVLTERTNEHMKVLYLDIQDAATRYGKSHKLGLVLHYNDATTAEAYYSEENIARKLQSGALLPLWATVGTDISKEIVKDLNARMGADEEAKDSRSPAQGKKRVKDKKGSPR